MGYYEDHIEAVAQRRAENLRVNGEERERKTLGVLLHWSETDVERIIKREYEILRKRAETQKQEFEDWIKEEISKK